MTRRPIRMPAVVLMFAALTALLLPGAVRAAHGGSHPGPLFTARWHGITKLSYRHAHHSLTANARTSSAAAMVPHSSANDIAPSDIGKVALTLDANLFDDGQGTKATTLAQNAAQVQDLSALDNQSNTGTSQFALYHQHPGSYLESHVTAAFLENYSILLTVPAFSTTMTYRTLITLYPNADAALASGDNALTQIANNPNLHAAIPCANASDINDPNQSVQTALWSIALDRMINVSDPNCHVLEVAQPDVNGDLVTEIYFLYQVDNILVESDITYKDTDFGNQSLSSTQQQALVGDFATVVSGISNLQYQAVLAADSSGPAQATPTNTSGAPPPPTNTSVVPHPTATATATPTQPAAQPEIRLDGIALEYQSKDKKLHNTTKLKSTQKAYFIAQIEVANAGFNTPSASITYSLKGKVLGTDQMQQIPTTKLASLHLKPQQVTGTQTLYFGDVVAFKSPKKTIKPNATVNATLGTAKDSNTITFKVTPNCTTKKGKKTCK